MALCSPGRHASICLLGLLPQPHGLLDFLTAVRSKWHGLGGPVVSLSVGAKLEVALTNLASLKQIIEDVDAVETNAFTLNGSRRSLSGLPAWKGAQVGVGNTPRTQPNY